MRNDMTTNLWHRIVRTFKCFPLDHLTSYSRLAADTANGASKAHRLFGISHKHGAAAGV